MTNYIINRVLQSIVTLFIVMLVVFFASRVSGDPALLVMPLDATEKEIEDMRVVLGTDKPVLVQFGKFFARASVGDFGESIQHKVPVMDLIGARLPNSFRLAGAAMVATLVIAIALGTVAAVWRNTPADLFVRIVGVLGLALPSFWIGILLIDLFAVNLEWLPVSGTGGPLHFILPAVVIGSTAVAGMMRLLRSQLIEVLNSDYIRTARAKGLAGPSVVFGHALRNALIPVLTVAGVFFAGLLGGSVVAESIFAWPGIGQLAFQAVTARDFPVMQAVVLITGAIIVGMNLAVGPPLRCHRSQNQDGQGRPMTLPGLGMTAARMAHLPLLATRRFWNQPRRPPIIPIFILVVIAVVAIIPNLIAPEDPFKTALPSRMLPPSWIDDAKRDRLELGAFDHILGTDQLGRDVLSRLLHGARVSLTVGFFAVTVAGGIGLTVGLLSGYKGGWVDAALMRLVDAVIAIPFPVERSALRQRPGTERTKRDHRH